MEKEFVPYELALKLKKLGFDEPCFGLYEHGKLGYSFSTSQGIPPISYRTNPEFVEHILTKEDCTAPTYSQAFRWFRKEHNLKSFIQPIPDDVDTYMFAYGTKVIEHDDLDYLTYEEAETACLEKLLEIVEKRNNE